MSENDIHAQWGDANQQLIRQMFKAIDASDWKALTNSFDVGIVYERPGYPAFVGIDPVLFFYQHQRIIASGTHHIEGMVTDSTSGACWGHFKGIGKNGSLLDELFAMFTASRTAKLVRGGHTSSDRVFDCRT